MNLTELQRRLMSAARSQAPDDRVPYAFEKRVLARLRDTLPVDAGAWWARMLWRAAGACAGLMILLAAFSIYEPAPASTAAMSAGAPTEFAQDLERTVLAAVDQENGNDSVW